ncbi:hypothetical protein PZB75_26590 [Streptomyces sp. AM 4-1-1]|uniref:hypothetical protein n=1 Tax=Streptomyces sp. AM 4-1-1 TaxID=3028710 RepID=UPI0023B9CD1B|nr:hypothetical protein [Streptomyces sp. AM 4-1-1]WEH36606.1 hypothetical protein PZB75_26590 [Streptomyces sp. AM 4-1-1]
MLRRIAIAAAVMASAGFFAAGPAAAATSDIDFEHSTGHLVKVGDIVVADWSNTELEVDNNRHHRWGHDNRWDHHRGWNGFGRR